LLEAVDTAIAKGKDLRKLLKKHIKWKNSRNSKSLE
jgi:hypothetical protein